MIYLDLPIPVNCRACACYDALRRDCKAMGLIDRERDNEVGEDKPEWCPIRVIDFTVMPLVKGDVVAQVETNIYDRVEEHHNCFVQILRNSVTNEISFGWKKEDDKPPKRICDCYHPNGYCLGTKEMDECGCGGDESKCDFYDYKRRKAND